MTEDRPGSRPWQIDAGSNSFAVASLTGGSISVCCPGEVRISYLRLDIRYPICGECEFVKRHLGFFQKS